MNMLIHQNLLRENGYDTATMAQWLTEYYTKHAVQVR